MLLLTLHNVFFFVQAFAKKECTCNSFIIQQDKGKQTITLQLICSCNLKDEILNKVSVGRINGIFTKKRQMSFNEGDSAMLCYYQ